jgi:hypothetical protein
VHRRQFLGTSLATAIAATVGKVTAQEPASRSSEFYLIRQYHLQAGPQMKLTESYFGDALIPALARMGMGPIGAFHLDFGPVAPTFYLLIPASSVEALAELDLRLAQDSTFLTAAEPFWNAPATAPAFLRIESSLLKAFEGWPRLTLPASSASKGKRIFQLRTYESPSNGDHVRKVEMFQAGEFQIFRKRRLPSGILRRYSHRSANAEHDLPAQRRRYGGDERKMGCVQLRSIVEEALHLAAVWLRGDCKQCSQPGFGPARRFPDLGVC